MDSDIPELTRMMAEGYEPAFRNFYDRYWSRIYRYLLVLCKGNEQSARDHLQTTMLKVARYIKPMKDETMLWGWLTRLARTSVIDDYRSKRRLKDMVSFEDHEFHLSANAHQNEDERLIEALESSLQSLNDTERNMVEAFYFQEKAQVEIARENNVTPKSVESSLSRIRQKLRKLIFRRLNS